ncbi:MAG: hypothetical protein ACLSTL_08725 [Eubacterium sp.]|nr:MAG: hypothetical protein DBY03_01280 [Clostridiales bacterium]
MVCRDKYGEWVKRIVGGVWSVGAKSLSGSRKLSAGCGLSGRKGRVGQEACWRSVVCRGENVAWVKGIGGGVWSVGAKRASGSKELSAEFGLSGRKGRVGQENCWRSVVCRDKFVAWVKGIGDGVWSVGSSLLSGSKELSAECGLSGQVWRVGQRNCRRSVVCRDKYGEWVKGIVGRVWSVGAKRASGSRGLSAGLVCRVKYGEWVKRIVGGVWSVGSSMASESRGLSVGVVCRGENVAWVKGTVARVWSVGAKMLRGSKGLSLECGLSA